MRDGNYGGLLGTKLGMSQLFQEDGRMVPVTILQTEGNVVVDVRESERDGYVAVQLGYLDKKRASKAEAGHAKRAGTSPKRHLVEFRGMAAPEGGLGSAVGVEIFEVGDVVDVTGTTKGRGFAGTVKRHSFSRQPQTHGGMARRRPGSIGQCAFPAEVFKGKRMSGHYGNARQTVQGLSVLKIDPEQQLVFVKGSVPGPTGRLVQIRHSVKGPKGKAGA